MNPIPFLRASCPILRGAGKAKSSRRGAEIAENCNYDFEPPGRQGVRRRILNTQRRSAPYSIVWRRNPNPVFSALSVCLRFISVNADGVACLAYTPAAMDAGTPDEELMLRFSGGDASAFDALYSRHRGGVFRYLLRQCGNRAAAEELFQDIWMNLVQARSRYKVEAKFSTYLYTLAHNRLMDHFRRRKGVDLVSLDQDEDDPPQMPGSATLQPERAAESREQAARLLSLVDALPAAQREAFLLQEEGGLSLEEIAQVTGSNREAVKSRLRYALGKLRDGMKDYL